MRSSTKKNPTETLKLKNTVTELKNSIESLNSAWAKQKEYFSEPEDRLFEIIQPEKKKKKIE